MHGRPGVVQHPEDDAEGLRVLVRVPRLEEGPGVLVVLELGFAGVVGRVRRAAVAAVDAARELLDVVEHAVTLPRVVVPDRSDRPEIARADELLEALQRRRRLRSLLRIRAERAPRLARVPPQHGRLPHVRTIHLHPGVGVAPRGDVVERRVLPVKAVRDRLVLREVRGADGAVAAEGPDERARVRSEVPHLGVERRVRNLLLLRGPRVLLPGAAADEAGHEHHAGLVGEVVEILVADRALEADRVQAHVLDVLDRRGCALRIEALEQVPDVAAAAEEDVLAVDLVADERRAVHRRSVVRELADAERDRLRVGRPSARGGRDTELVQLRAAELVRPPQDRVRDVQLRVRGRVEDDLASFVRVQRHRLGHGDRGRACLRDRPADRRRHRRVRRVERVDVHGQVGRVRGGEGEDGLHVRVAQRDGPRRVEERLAPEPRVHVGCFRVPVDGAEGKVVAAVRGRRDEDCEGVRGAGMDEIRDVVLVQDHRPDGARVELRPVEPDLRAVADAFEAKPVRLARRRRGRVELAAVPPVLSGEIRDGLEVRAEVDVLVDVVRHEAREHSGRDRDRVPARRRVADLGDRRATVGDVVRRAKSPPLGELGRGDRRRRRRGWACAPGVPYADREQCQRGGEEQERESRTGNGTVGGCGGCPHGWLPSPGCLVRNPYETYERT